MCLLVKLYFAADLRPFPEYTITSEMLAITGELAATSRLSLVIMKGTKVLTLGAGR